MSLLELEDGIFGEQPALKQTALVNLKAYKYRSVDKSPLSYYLLNPYWTWAAKFMPPWLAPNVITLLGFFAIYFNIMCIEIYMPDLTSPGPGWLYVTFALGLWFYQTMDNIDGKQARKTGTSSPLGELFDHGIDSLNCCLGGLVQSACMGLGSSGAAAVTIFSTCLAMYTSTWETYHTHVLYLGYINGPTEGIVIAVLVMLFTGYKGPEIWQQSAIEVFGQNSLLGFLLGDEILKDVWVVLLVLSVTVLHVPFCLYNVYEAVQKEETSHDFGECIWQLTPIITLGVSVWFWCSSPYSILLSQNHLVLFTLTLSFVFGRTTTSIILAHLTKQEFPYWNLSQLPLFFGAFLFDILPRVGIQFPAFMELMYLWGYFIFSVVYFLQYSTLVINKLCDFLEISCFTVRKPLELGKMS